jgi:hypothetical protein
MNSVYTIVLGTIVALSSYAADAQTFIQIEFVGQAQSDSKELHPIGLRAVFDTSAPPIEPNIFESVSTEVVQWWSYPGTAYNPDLDLPMITNNTTIEYQRDTPAQFRYYPELGIYEIYMRHNEIGYTAQVQGTKPAFTADMTSLPNSSDDYGVALPPSQGFIPRRIEYFANGPEGSFASARWSNPFEGIINTTGQLQVRVTRVENPNTDECIADLNNDGALNFLDISAYLQLYGDGCP